MRYNLKAILRVHLQYYPLSKHPQMIKIFKLRRKLRQQV